MIKNKNIILFIIFLIIILIFFIINKNINIEHYQDKNYLDGIDIIYWINLEESIDRKNNMLNMFKDPIFKNKNIERINAIHGKKVNLNNYIDNYNNKNYTSKSEYGCLLSHLETIRKFSNSNYNIALILEDDCTLEFKKYWKNNIKQIIKEAPSDWEIIQLCYIQEDKNHPIHNWNNKEKYLKPHQYSTLSYLINKKGAKKIINSIYDFNKNKYKLNDKNTAYVADVFIYNKLNTFVYKYPYFIYISNNDSTIHSDHISAHDKSKQIIINNYKKSKLKKQIV
jgi:GR25 family glycosyltransferase involved in LPS biosynthesis